MLYIILIYILLLLYHLAIIFFNFANFAITIKVHCCTSAYYTIVYCSAVNAAILLHFYTMILLYPLEYFSSAGVHSSLST